MLNFLNAILGTALLVAGRKLFWLFVGVIGFVIGIQVAMRFFHSSELTMLIAGIVLGAIFAILAVFVESLAIGIAGFLGGGYLLLMLAAAFGFDKGIAAWVIFIVGGIFGAAMIAWLFDWTLIIISSLAGSSMILDAFHFGRLMNVIMFIILVLIGITIQSSTLHTEKREKGKHV